MSGSRPAWLPKAEATGLAPKQSAGLLLWRRTRGCFRSARRGPFGRDPLLWWNSRA